MISQSYEKEATCEEDNDDNADGRSGEQFKVKMPLAEKPATDSAKDRASAGCWTHWYRGVDRRIYHKCVFCPVTALIAVRRQYSPKQSQYQIRTRYKPSAGATKREPSVRPDFNLETISSSSIL